MKKNITIVALSFTALSAYAAPNLSSYYCKHKTNLGFESSVRYDFRIIENAELDRGNHDTQKSVNVERIRVTRSNASLFKSFPAVAITDDVEYSIDAGKANDFQFSMYLDELNEPATVISHDSSGNEVTEQYICKQESR